MRKYKLLLLTLAVMALWGSLFPMVKLGYKAYEVAGIGDILLFAGIRFTICGAVICIYAFISDKSSYKEAKSSMLPILLSGLFAIILHYGFTYTALTMTDSSKTAIIKQLGALLYICFSFLFFKEDKLTAQKLVGALLGFSGIIAINYGNGKIDFNLGTLLVICASFCTVFSNVIGKKALATVKPVTMTGISQLFGGIVLLAVGVGLGGDIIFNFNKWYIFAYICIASTISYCIWFGAVKKGELSKLFIIKFAEPIFACIFGAFILSEDIFKLQYLIALVLISLGIIIANKTRSELKT